MSDVMEAIKVTRGCGASGRSLQAGTVYTVPAQVSEADASLLVRLGKAELYEAPKGEKPTKAKSGDVQ